MTTRRCFSPCCIYLFMFLSFPGVMRGGLPHGHTPSCLKFSSESPSRYALGVGGNPPAVIPEIFNRESMFLLFLWYLNTVDPGLKIAGGDEKRGNRTIRGQAKNARKSPG